VGDEKEECVSCHQNRYNLLHHKHHQWEMKKKNALATKRSAP
jgi:hypothetical protein